MSKDFRMVIEEEELEKEVKGEDEAVDILSPSSSSFGKSDSIFDGGMNDQKSPSSPEDAKKKIMKLQPYTFSKITGPSHKPKKSEYKFMLPTRYVPLRLMGEGAYGFVIAAFDKKKEINVAIKVIALYNEDNAPPTLRSHDFLKRILREILLLRHFVGHPSIIELIDLVPSPDFEAFRYCYVITDLMDSDLYKKVREEAPLSNDFVRRMTYDTLKGLRYIHTADVLHRDIKPQNILLKKEGPSKICDFGLSRGVDFDVKMSTNYVVTRWYRAPELLMMWGKTPKSIDVWSVGCVLAELMSGEKNIKRVLFKGTSWIDQLEKIVKFRGTPKRNEMLGNPSAIRFVMGLGTHQKQSLKRKYPKASDDCLDLLDKLLTFDAKKRISAEDAIQHPYFKDYYENDLANDKDSVLKVCKSFSVRVSDKLKPEQLRRILFDCTLEWSKGVNDYEKVIVIQKTIKLEEKD